MRSHGKMMKNLAGLLLLLALLSMLLPFCKFNAGSGNMTLSGIEVIKTGGKAGYTYFKTGGIPDDYVVKSPYTWGNIKESILYINQAGGAKILLFCGIVIAIPIILCFLAMIMLFMAEGKKTMSLPTLFTIIVSMEMLFIVFGFKALHPFLMIGVYLFTLLNILALIFILAGWITGGYRQPDSEQQRYEKGRKNSDGNGGDNDHSHRRRKRRKTRRKTKKKKDRSSGKDNDKNENDEKSKEKKKEQTKPAGQPVTGMIGDGSGIYHGFSWDLKNSSEPSITIGTTFDAVEALESKSLRGIDSIAENNCKITFDTVAKKYNVESHSKAAILILQDGKVVKWLKNGQSYEVTAKSILQVDGRRDFVKLG